MKKLIVFLILLVLIVWAGVEIARDPGYMLLAYRHWTLETPLWFGIILWLVVILVIMAGLQLWRSIHNLSTHFYEWRAKRRLTKANNLTVRGTLECLEGYYDSALKNFNKSFNNSELPLINYLIAAYCAAQLNQRDQADEFLKKAIQTNPEAELACQLGKVQWLMNAGQHSDALTEVERILHDDPYQNKALTLAKELYLHNGQWQSLLKTAALMRKRKLLTAEEFLDLQNKAYAALLNEASNDGTQSLNTCWLTIPAQLQAEAELILQYARLLIKHEQGDRAEQLLRDLLKKQWSNDVVLWYGLANSSDSENQLKNAEKWLNQHENDAELLLTLGRLCTRCQLWGKARSYLEASLAIQKRPETYQALADLMQGHGDSAKAAEYYQKGLALALQV